MRRCDVLIWRHVTEEHPGCGDTFPRTCACEQQEVFSVCVCVSLRNCKSASLNKGERLSDEEAGFETPPVCWPKAGNESGVNVRWYKRQVR